jgi:hypothetical protein
VRELRRKRARSVLTGVRAGYARAPADIRAVHARGDEPVSGVRRQALGALSPAVYVLILTPAYLAGRANGSSVRPAFLVSSLVLFGVLRFAAESMNILELDNAMQTEASGLRRTQPAVKDKSAGEEMWSDREVNFGRGSICRSR